MNRPPGVRFYVHKAGSADRLAVNGAIIAAKLRPSKELVIDLTGQGLPVPAADVDLQLDTGASMSFIEVGVARGLGLVTMGGESVLVASHETIYCPAYRATIELPLEMEDPSVPRRVSSTMAPIPLTIYGLPNARRDVHFHGLLGRDFLRAFALLYSGTDGVAELRTTRDWTYATAE